MALRSIALDGDLRKAAPTDLTIEVVLRASATETKGEYKMVVPQAGDVLFGVGPHGAKRYKRTDLRTSDGALVYVLAIQTQSRRGLSNRATSSQSAGGHYYASTGAGE